MCLIDPSDSNFEFFKTFNFLRSHVTSLKKLLHIAQPVIQSNLNWKIGNAQCMLTKNEQAECDAIKKRSLMPIAPREGGTPLFSDFFLFFREVGEARVHAAGTHLCFA